MKYFKATRGKEFDNKVFDVNIAEKHIEKSGTVIQNILENLECSTGHGA